MTAPVRVVEPAEADNAAALREALQRDGALLLPPAEPALPPLVALARFEALTQRLCGSFHEVGTRQALRQAAGDGFTTEVFRSNFVLLGHCEGRYRPWPPPPDVCFFHCQVAPRVDGGETLVIDGAALLEQLPADLRQRLAHEGVVYECQWEPARWQAEFGVDDGVALRRLLDGLPGVRYTFDDASAQLHLFSHGPAIAPGLDGRPAFANGVLAHLPRLAHARHSDRGVYVRPTNRVHWGGGGELTDDEVGALVDAHDAVAWRHRWRDGETLVLDNTRFLHGRERTAEPCERVLISRFGRWR